MEMHQPVLLEEVIKLLEIDRDGIYLDGTIGRGGHAREIIAKLKQGEGFLIGIDKDREAIRYCQENLPVERVKLFHASFVETGEILAQLGIDGVDGILLDLGVSSPQLDKAERGFSYQEDAPLDMRMNREQEMTAARIVNNYPQSELTEILRKYGEERWASRIAEFIVKRREREPLDSTYDLVEVIKAAIPAGARRSGGHPARRTFQALRIETNNELKEVEEMLDMGPGLLNKGGRFCVISFHSLEDRLVKHTFREKAKSCVCPPDFPICRCDKVAELKVITSSPIQADQEERDRNPRARSAKLRAAEKIC